MKDILITGGTGFFGTALARHLLTQTYCPHRIVLFSRSEHRQADLAREFAPLDPRGHLRFFIGDVRDQDRLRRAMTGIGAVVHAAALKRIEVGQYNPMEVKKTNIDGTANVIEAAIDSGIREVLLLSSDKAYQPVSPYGTSKAFAESLILAANNMRGHYGPRFSVCRYGNVWESQGSVVPTWRSILKTSDTVPVTDPDCTRFFMTVQQAIDLVVDTLTHMMGGETVIPKLPAYRLGDLAEAMEAKFRVTGLPNWEKKHESMGPGNSSDVARRMAISELQMALGREKRAAA